MLERNPLLHDGNQMKNRRQRKGSKRHAKQARAPANNREDGVQQADGIQRGSHTQPHDAHFRHVRVCSGRTGIPARLYRLKLKYNVEGRWTQLTHGPRPCLRM